VVKILICPIGILSFLSGLLLHISIWEECELLY
jgi:hypothetical protein